MIVTGAAMTSRARAWAGTQQTPVLAPLAVLVSSALLVLSQLYLAIPLAPIIGEVLGRGGSAAAAALGTTYALANGLGFLIFGPLSDRYGRKPILVPGWQRWPSSRRVWLRPHRYPCWRCCEPFRDW
jgi:MFS family permease